MKVILLKDAAALIRDGACVMIGGFKRVGTPERLVDELVRQGRRNLTVIANDNALPGAGVGPGPRHDGAEHVCTMVL